MKTDGPTLTEALASVGFTHRKSANVAKTQAHDILRGGAVVFSGTAHDTWEWLRKRLPEPWLGLTIVHDRYDFRNDYKYPPELRQVEGHPYNFGGEVWQHVGRGKPGTGGVYVRTSGKAPPGTMEGFMCPSGFPLDSVS